VTRIGLAVVLAAVTGCGPIRSSTIGLRSMREQRHAAFFVDGTTIVVRDEGEMGLAVVAFDPSVDDGHVVLNAGVASSGGPGTQVQCVDVAPLALPADWVDRLAWREPDGTLAPITEVERGDTAHELALRCRS
jgi:hypothetical protein